MEETTRPQPMLTVSDIQTRLVVSRKTVMALVGSKQLIGFQVGRQWRFEPRDLDRFIAAQKSAHPLSGEPQRGRAPSRVHRSASSSVSWPGADRYR